MFHRAKAKGQDPYLAPEEQAQQNAPDNSARWNDRSFENYQNAPRTGLNQTAVQDYVREHAENPDYLTANQNRFETYAVEKKTYDGQTIYEPPCEEYIETKDLNHFNIEEANDMNNPDQKDQPQQNNNNTGRVDIPGSQFSRPGIPGQTPGQTPGQPGAVRPAYPGSYPGVATQPANAQGGYQQGQQSNNDIADNKLVIGSGITLSGEIESCDHLIVQGTVEASLKGASVLDIAEQGAFFGTVDIQEATIAGRFEGDVTVQGRLTVESTGIIIGTIAYKELSIEAGATLEGSISPIGSQATQKKTAPQRPKKVSKSNDAELPFADKRVAME